MKLLVKLAKMMGYGQTLKGGKDLYNHGVHVESHIDDKSPKSGKKDLFNNGAHRGKPHKPPRIHPHLDHDSGNNDWCY